MLLRWTEPLTRPFLQRRTFSLLRDLQERGFVQDITSPHAFQQSLSAPRTVYAGIDPTAKSLHIGHLMPFMCLLHFQLNGHRIIPLIGGATGLIGDPSGRSTERQLAEIQQVENNVASLTEAIHTFFTRAYNYAKVRLPGSLPQLEEPTVLSNLDWHQRFTMLDFLRTVGVHSRISTMISRDSVKARLNSQQGISFTEFTYQLLQAYDFCHLYKNHSCSIQIGGSDQWGNIVAGLELIGRLEGHSVAEQDTPAFGITTPLLTTATGEKFGKSAGNAVWLNSNLTSVFDLYQYFIKVADEDVEKYLKLFTLLPLPDIHDIIATHDTQPEKRIAQRRLAAEVVELIHTREGLQHAETMTKLLFDFDYSNLRAHDVIKALSNDPRLISIDELEILQTPLPKLVAKYGLVASNSAAKTLVNARGLYLNNSTVLDANFTIGRQNLIDGRLAILRAGKDKVLVLAVKACT
ncbi:hypothetical protein M378DRAFT_23477 [Amanita muscaria Koide BX008]|uniref:Tyrosine--tRNA ligase n=1 Tax=Amanita muscaria (strain Koide BX008) TaxID=946122 RepID=A0A0C2XA76_AMAMK|nr:hypothetical protein M378DRAFT_23477 [Amanita muscaria Koide BX008]